MTMTTSSAALKQMAREQLFGKYNTVILSFFVMQLILSTALSIAEPQTPASTSALIIYYAIYFIVLLFEGVFNVGQNHLYLRIRRENTCSFSDMWYAFKTHADKAIAIQFITIISALIAGIPFIICTVIFTMTEQMFLVIICALTFILFVAASIMLQLMFSQAFYLLIDRPELKARELIECSIQLMKGHKAKLFYINVSFIGMYLLVILTMGIGILWVYPYISMVRANFYAELTKTPATSIDVSV